MMEALNQVLLKIDIFGYQPSFRIFGKSKYSTSLGILSTVLTLSLTIIFFSVQLNALIHQASPIIRQTEKQLQETSEFSLLQNNFTIAVSMTDQNQQPLFDIEKYFQINIRNCYFERTQNTTSGNMIINMTCYNYTLEQCTTSHFPSHNQQEFFSNIILSVNNLSYYTQIDQYLIQNDFMETNDLYNSAYLIDHLITLDKKKTIIYRSYTSIFTLMSNVGGLYSILFLIISIIIKPLRMILVEISLANKTFRFEINENNKQMLPIINNDDVVADIIKSSRQCNEKIDVKDKKNLFLINKYFEQKNEQIALSFKQIMLILFGCDKQRKKQLIIAKQQFKYQLDISHIMKKLYEIDKLKYILLNNDQRIVFDCLPKPMIKQQLNNNDEFIQYTQFEEYLFSDKLNYFINDAYISFKNIVQQNKINQIDRALLGCFDDGITKLFQQVTLELEEQSELENGSIIINNQENKIRSSRKSQQIKLSQNKLEDLSISSEGIPQLIQIHHKLSNQQL